eukprot:scaffold2342_cov248-Ochromonas_danica.AAC.4
MTGRLLIYALAQSEVRVSPTAQGCTPMNATWHIELFEAILNWQNGNKDRECKIIGCGSVKQLVNIVIGHPSIIHSSSHSVQQALSSSSAADMIDATINTSSGNFVSDGDNHHLHEQSRSLLDQPSGTTRDKLWTTTSNNFQYLILPHKRIHPLMNPFDHEGIDLEEDDEEEELPMELHFHDSVVWMTSKLCYEVLSNKRGYGHGVRYIPCHSEWYHDINLMKQSQGEIVYRIHIMKHDNLYVAPVEEEDDFSHNRSNSMASLDHEEDDDSMRSGDVSSWVFIQEIMHAVDLFEVILGPIVGQVTSTSAQVLFEVNMDLHDGLECRLSPSDRSDDNDDNDESSVTT